MKTTLALAASAVVLLAGLASPAAASVPETVIKPGALERGADIAVPHLEGKTLVDGDVRVGSRAARSASSARPGPTTSWPRATSSVTGPSASCG